MTAKDGETEVSKKRKIRLETMRVDRLPMWTPGLPDMCPCTMPEASKSQNLELGLREGWAYLADSRYGLKQQDLDKKPVLSLPESRNNTQVMPA